MKNIIINKRKILDIINNNWKFVYFDYSGAKIDEKI